MYLLRAEAPFKQHAWTRLARGLCGRLTAKNKAYFRPLFAGIFNLGWMVVWAAILARAVIACTSRTVQFAGSETANLSLL